MPNQTQRYKFIPSEEGNVCNTGCYALKVLHTVISSLSNGDLSIYARNLEPTHVSQHDPGPKFGAYLAEHCFCGVGFDSIRLRLIDDGNDGRLAGRGDNYGAVEVWVGGL